MLIASSGNYNQTWLNTLSDRIYFDHVLEAVRGGQGARIDPESLRQEAAKEASNDITRYLRDETVWFEWGGFKKTAVGVGYFVWYWISYGIFYGIAGVVGSSLRGTY